MKEVFFTQSKRRETWRKKRKRRQREGREFIGKSTKENVVRGDMIHKCTYVVSPADT